MDERKLDVIFVGGGLASTLIAYRLRQVRPGLRLLILEAGDSLGGNHTWSFHDSDISGKAREWIAPFIAKSWPRQEVIFPKYSRVLSIGYNTIFPDSLNIAARRLLEGSILLSARAASVGEAAVELDDGRIFSAPCVIDARGPGRNLSLTLGYQKFAGLVVRFEQPHGQAFPIIMDASVPQQDGYRFVYTLPFTSHEALIEDTYYSDTPDLDFPRLRENCLHYCKQRGWTVSDILREERGVLPVVLGGDADTFMPKEKNSAPALGARGGFFHHTTSYSFPIAVRCADAIASLQPLTSEKLRGTASAWARRHWREQRFFRLLNRMLFWAAKPDRRYRVLERFYELREPLIERFYNSSLTRADQARILAGWPPVPIGRALRVLKETRANPIAGATSWSN